MFVLGHSGATGENSDPSKPRVEVRANSWATGTNPVVKSLYLRILAKNTAIQSHAVNLAPRPECHRAHARRLRLNLGYHLGSVERVGAAARQGSAGVTPLREAAWLIELYIALLEKRLIGADLHLSATRLA
jgi:hypothetical protein